jgi:hypothetical protein
MSTLVITCVLCDRVVPPNELERSYQLRHFDDVVICPECWQGERFGHGKTAAHVRDCLERVAPATKGAMRA